MGLRREGAGWGNVEGAQRGSGENGVGLAAWRVGLRDGAPGLSRRSDGELGADQEAAACAWTEGRLGVELAPASESGVPHILLSPPDTPPGAVYFSSGTNRSSKLHQLRPSQHPVSQPATHPLGVCPSGARSNSWFRTKSLSESCFPQMGNT